MSDTTAATALQTHVQKPPVPWVTRWTGEIIKQGVTVSVMPDGQPFVHYRDGNETRDASGVLWMKEGLTRAGEPQYGDVNVYRQRLSMLKAKCQVCGCKIEERPILWLMSRLQLEIQDSGVALTTSPPTCADCIPVALELCPHLKLGENAVILKVLEYQPWGVRGDFVSWDQDGSQKLHQSVIMPYSADSRMRSRIVAKQLVIELIKWVEVK